MQVDLDHAHVFASDIDATVRWWTDMLGAQKVFDLAVAGARNVRLSIGRGAVQFYDQPPRVVGQGTVHHLGVLTDDLEGLVASMESKGYKFRDSIVDAGVVKFIMCAAPDDLLVELYQVKQPPQ